MIKAKYHIKRKPSNPFPHVPIIDWILKDFNLE